MSFAKPPKVLQIAFGCNPEGHGELWLGWGWAEQAAKFCDLHLITSPYFREAVERHAYRAKVTVHFVEIPPWLERASRKVDLAGRWIRQAQWQKSVAEHAAALHAREHFDLIHQTTYHTFRTPFAATTLDVPAVWGPIAGGEQVPAGFGPWLGPARAAEAVRPVLNRLWLATPAVQRSLRRAKVLMVSNQTTRAFLPAWCHDKIRVVPPNALRGDLSAPRSAPLAGGPLRLLYAGNCVGTRSLPLVFEAMRSANALCELTIAGTGDAIASWRDSAARLGLTDRVHFVGHVNREELSRLYAEASAFVFPALRDSGGSGLLEAMSLGLPVICLDWAGPAEMVDAESGFKVPVRTPAETIDAMAAVFRQLHADPSLGERVGRAGAARCTQLFTWEHKRHLLEEIYTEALSPR